ncbi:hypothetical protein XENOCAPTIV_027285, partial [Xenoophorus captivus]
DVRLLILEHSRWSMVEKYQALMAGLASEELMEFSRSFRAELYAEGLIDALKQMSRDELISWYQEHRGATSRKLSVHVRNAVTFRFDTGTRHFHYTAHTFMPLCHFMKVVGFGAEENDEEGGGKNQEGKADKEEDVSESTYGEVSKLTFLPASTKIEGAITIMDIPAFIKGLPLFPYHKILE